MLELLLALACLSLGFAGGFFFGVREGVHRTPEVYIDEPKPPADSRALVEVHVAFDETRVVRTDMTVDKRQLESLANAIGRYTLPMPTSRSQ